MKRLILHAGADKTGTTSIQMALIHNEELLRERGYHVLESNRARPGSGKHRLMWRQPEHSSWEDLAREAHQLVDQDVQVIMSNESLWLQSPEVFARIGALFPGFEKMLVLYVREQADYIQSLALQRQKKADKAFDFTDPDSLASLLDRRRFHMEYDRTCERYEEALGDGAVNARLFDRSSFVGNDLVLDFFDTIGVHDSDSVDVHNDANRSIRVEFAQILRRQETTPPEGLRSGELQDIALRLSADGLGSKYFLDRSQVEHVRAQYRDSNKRFAERFLRNADAIPEKDVWRTEELCDLDELERQMVQVARDLPTLSARGWSGSRYMGSRLFSEGWRIEMVDRSALAHIDNGAARMRFRIAFKHRHNFSEDVVLAFGTRDSAKLVVDVTANGNELGRHVLPHEHIAVPLESCQPHDQIELALHTVDGDPPPIVRLDLVAVAGDGEK